MGGAGVLGEHLEGAFVQAGRQLGEQLGREVHLELVPLVGFDPAVAGFGLGIGKGQVGLDVVDGRAVHHVGADHVQRGSPAAIGIFLVELYACQLDAR